jgi:DNA-binding MarR family transcriptional regulator
MNDKPGAMPIAFSLIHAARIVEERLEAALAEVDLSGPKFTALSALVAAGESMSLSDLAAQLTCVRSNVTQLVDRLEADGLVRRVEDPKDRRSVRAEVTRLGRERQAAGAKLTGKVHAELAKQLSASDREQFQRALGAIQ